MEFPVISKLSYHEQEFFCIHNCQGKDRYQEIVSYDHLSIPNKIKMSYLLQNDLAQRVGQSASKKEDDIAPKENDFALTGRQLWLNQVQNKT